MRCWRSAGRGWPCAARTPRGGGDSLRKGASATASSTRSYAPDARFAHDVREALDGVGGNVDHVVLTGVGVWVVETKAAWLDEGPFRDALRQTAANVQRVRRELGRPDVPVRAALVIPDNQEPFEADYDWKGEPVTAFRVVSFCRRLQEECGQADGASEIREREEVANEVWSLGSTRHLDS